MQTVARQAGVVDEHVELAGLFDERAASSGVGDVRLDGARRRSRDATSSASSLPER